MNIYHIHDTSVFTISKVDSHLTGSQTEFWKQCFCNRLSVVKRTEFWPEDLNYIKQIKRK